MGIDLSRPLHFPLNFRGLLVHFVSCLLGWKTFFFEFILVHLGFIHARLLGFILRTFSKLTSFSILNFRAGHCQYKLQLWVEDVAPTEQFGETGEGQPLP